MGVGKQIKKILEEKGVTIKDLSLMSGISLNTLYSITKRDSNNISKDVLERLTMTLDVPAKVLFGFNEIIPPELIEKTIDEAYIVNTPDGLLLDIVSKCQMLNSDGRLKCYEFLKELSKNPKFFEVSENFDTTVYQIFRNAICNELLEMKESTMISEEDYLRAYYTEMSILHLPYLIDEDFNELNEEERMRTLEILEIAKLRLKPRIDSGEIIDPYKREDN